MADAAGSVIVIVAVGARAYICASTLERVKVAAEENVVRPICIPFTLGAAEQYIPPLVVIFSPFAVSKVISFPVPFACIFPGIFTVSVLLPKTIWFDAVIKEPYPRAVESLYCVAEEKLVPVPKNVFLLPVKTCAPVLTPTATQSVQSVARYKLLYPTATF